MVCKPARPSAALELRGSLHDGPDGTRIGIAHAIYVKPLVARRLARGHRSPSMAPLRGSLRSALAGRPGLRGGRARSCGEEGLGGVRGQVADHAPMDDIGEVALEDAAGLLLGVVVRARLGVEALGARL